jgi:hypothetical protein
MVSFARDYQWAEYSVRSMQKYATGFAGVTICVPWNDLGQFLPLEQRTTKDGAPIFVKKYLEMPGKGMLHHQVMKLSADLFNPEATYFMHMDSDCLFTEPVTPEDYFGRTGLGELLPIIQCVRYTAFPAGRAEYLWQKNVIDALDLFKEEVPFETMQRHPSVYYKTTYKQMRSRIEEVHKTRFEQYVLERENNFPQTFADWPTMGGYAYEYERERYFFEELAAPDIQRHPKQAHKVMQFWSHSNKEPRSELHRKQLEIVNRILI